MNELSIKHEIISQKLMSAYALLAKDIIESDFGYRKKDFLKYIQVNELSLAMEELEGVKVDNNSPCSKFWSHLIMVAKLMNKKAHISKYEAYL